MSKKMLILLAVLCLIVPACRRRPAEHGVVYRITVESSGERAVYTKPEKMSWILNSLRQLGQKTNPPVDPETLPAESYRITLDSTDGGQTVYHTKGERYLRKNQEPWRQTEPQALFQLLIVLHFLPPDG